MPAGISSVCLHKKRTEDVGVKARQMRKYHAWFGREGACFLPFISLGVAAHSYLSGVLSIDLKGGSSEFAVRLLVAVFVRKAWSSPRPLLFWEKGKQINTQPVAESFVPS